VHSDIPCDGLMNHWEMENAVAFSVALKEAGFQVSQVCCSRPSCFDFAAKKDDKTVLIKTHSDIDSFSHLDSAELKVIANHVSAASLIVSQRTHDKPLEDDTVYSRYAILVVTEKTIRNIALQTANPLVYAGPGGYFVEIDGALVGKRRNELGLSIGKLADMIGVSRRTLYGYERGMTKASVSSAYNLAKTLGIPVAKPINVLERTRKQHQHLRMKAEHAIAGQPLLLKVFRVFRKFALCNVSPVRKAPFDFVMNVPDEKHAIVGSVAMKDERHLGKRMEETLSVCRVVNAHPVLITEKRKPHSRDIPCVCMDELSALRTPEDLITSV
jgi:putative transcriptional regulator